MTAGPLEVRGLRVTYGEGAAPVVALDGLDLDVAPGESLGILGESGSGKSTLARALLGLLSEATVEGEIRLGDLRLDRLDEPGWRPIRWRRIALAFQSTSALNPVLRVGSQVEEPLRVHLGLSRATAQARALQLLGDVGLDPGAAERYPRELSGGQRRLALLAVAVACEPDVLVLDEPTAGLDPVTCERVIAYLHRLRERVGTTIVTLGHDVEALERLADRVAVLYRGWLAELGPAGLVLTDPRHPYTRGLLGARPTLATIKELRGIRGQPPNPAERPHGCPFRERCTQPVEPCETLRPPLEPSTGEADGRSVACLRGGLVRLLAATDLSKTFAAGTGVVRRRRIRAVDGVSLDVREGEVVGIAGSTGAGKSTLAMLLAGLLAADGGTVVFEGAELTGSRPATAVRRRLQLVFQDPFEALSPRLTVREALREPLEVQGLAGGAETEFVLRAALAATRLPTDDAFLSRRTHELSGGQLQRVGLARALVLDPKLLVLDEPVAMLDPSEQAELLQLLKAIQVERGMAMVLISHDLATILRTADRVYVLDQGRVVEEGTGTRILVRPQHAVTRSLLDASGRAGLFAGAERAPPPPAVSSPPLASQRELDARPKEARWIAERS